MFWWRHKKQVGLPAIGSGVDELHNLVPGSPVTATQSTSAEQPTNRADHIELDGSDDNVILSNISDFDIEQNGGYGWFVGTRAAGAPNYTIMERQNTANLFDPRYSAYTASGSIQRFMMTNDAETAFEAELTGLSLDSLHAVAWRYDASNDGMKLWVYNGSLVSDTATFSGTFSQSKIDDGRYFKRFNDTNELDGDCMEIGEANCAPSDDFVETMLDQLVYEHGI